MTSVRMSQDGILSMTPAAAEALAMHFNQVMEWFGHPVELPAARSVFMYVRAKHCMSSHATLKMYLTGTSKNICRRAPMRRACAGWMKRD